MRANVPRPRSAVQADPPRHSTVETMAAELARAKRDLQEAREWLVERPRSRRARAFYDLSAVRTHNLARALQKALQAEREAAR